MRSASGSCKQAHGQKSFAQAGKKEPVHHQLDALVYSARWMKTDAGIEVWSWNMTTTNRRGTKTSTTFSVFLLTGFLQKLILRFADFGERGSARAGFSVSGNDWLRNHVAAEHQTKKERDHLRCEGCAVKQLP
jgi:hypothetical protein